MTRVVLDTNVVVSAALSPAGSPSQILEMADQRIIQFWISPAVFAEYADVLSRLKVGVAPARAKTMLTGIKGMSRFITPTTKVEISSDPDDNIFLECAEAAKARYLVTGNTRHSPEQWKYIRVVTPKKFIDVVGPPTQNTRRK